jgi:hypothetical protein
MIYNYNNIKIPSDIDVQSEAIVDQSSLDHEFTIMAHDDSEDKGN